MEKLNHTPLNWELLEFDDGSYNIHNPENGGTIAVNVSKDDGKFIIRAVNSHYELVEACKLIVENCELNSTWDKVGQGYYKAKQALAKATGKDG